MECADLIEGANSNLDAGGDPHIKDDQGETALDLA